MRKALLMTMLAAATTTRLSRPSSRSTANMPLAGLEAGVGSPSWTCRLSSTSMRFRRQDGGAAGLTCRGPQHPIDTQLQEQGEEAVGRPGWWRLA